VWSISGRSHSTQINHPYTSRFSQDKISRLSLIVSATPS